MKAHDLILALFFSDAYSLVFENIKLSEESTESLPESSRDDLKSLSLKFLGPLFLTANIEGGKNWKMESIESSLTLKQKITGDVDLIQSFFTLNSSLESEGNMTNLFALIGSPYTEDIKLIYEKMVKFIHPSIIQGRIMNESVYADNFNFNEFIKEELRRGVNLIEYSLGSARRMGGTYWEEQKDYHCIGIIERVKSDDLNTSHLYTYEPDDPIVSDLLQFIPSFYVMAIIPEYYEYHIKQTLKLFQITSVHPNLRVIKLTLEDKQVIYLEEYLVENEIIRSLGVILISENEIFKDSKNLSHYKKDLRLILDKRNDLLKSVVGFSSKFDPFNKWDTNSEEGLNNIKNLFDKKNT